VLATAAIVLSLGAASGNAAVMGRAVAPHAGSNSCDAQSGTGGLDAEQLCWLDWSNFNLSDADQAAGQNMTWTLLNGYTLTATVQDTTKPNTAATTPGTGTGNGASGLLASPQLTSFGFGTLDYVGLSGDPVLYQGAQGYTDTVTLTNIAVTNPSGAPVDNFQLVGSDAENTGINESIQFSSNTTSASTGGPAWNELFEANGGTFCQGAGGSGGGIAGNGTSTIFCGSNSSSNTGDMVAMTEAPSTAAVTIAGSGKEGFALGIIEAPTQPSGNDVYQENFANGVTNSAESIDTNAMTYSGGSEVNVDGTGGLTAYAGGPAADNETYTADQYWSPSGAECDGIVLSDGTTFPTGADFSSSCTAAGWGELQGMAYGMGEYEGGTSAQDADTGVLSEFTAGSDPEQGGCASATPAGEKSGTTPGEGDSCIQFETSPSQIPVTTGHFYMATADYGVINYNHDQASECDGSTGGNGDPSISFYLTAPGSSPVTLGSGLDPCTSPNSIVYAVGNGTDTGTQSASQDILAAQLQSRAGIWTGGSTAGVEQTNANEGGDGNDGATTDIQVLDVTPSLSEAFAAADVTTGQPATLTYTVTNTAELAAKDDFAFTDTLPTGLSVVSGSTPTTTCSDGPNTQVGRVNASGQSVNLTTGSLAAGASTCTVTVEVTSSTPGTITDAPSDLSGLNGLIAPTGSGPSVTFQDASLSATETVSPSPVVPGGPMALTIDLANGGPASAADATATYTVPADVTVGTLPNGCTQSGSTITCDAGTLADGANKSFTIPMTVSPSATGTLTNAVALSTTTPQNGATKGTGAGASVTLAPQSAITLTDTASTPSVAPGQSVVYTVTAANAGPSDANPYTVTDTFGPGVEVTADTIPGGTCTITGNPIIGQTVKCVVPDLAAGKSVAASITAEPLTDKVSLANTVGATANGSTTSVAPAGGAPTVTTASVAGATDSLTTTTSGDSATATATASNPNDPAAVPVSYSWNWGDGTAATTSSTDSASHTYTKAGTYMLTSTVTYSDGTVVTTTKTVTITAASNSCGGSVLWTHILKKKLTTTGLTMSGNAEGKCGDVLKKVQVAIARIKITSHGEKCSFLSAKHKWGAYGNCNPKHNFTAKGTTKWTYSLKFKFAPAHYWVWENVVDTAGQASPNTASKHSTFHLK
jgi:uncharacterized repeat protein (TIGR01451 family)